MITNLLKLFVVINSFPLKGNWEGHRECHIGGDFLLTYKLDDNGKHGLIVFVRTGTRAELFNE
jgi:mRNA interferase YafQ